MASRAIKNSGKRPAPAKRGWRETATRLLRRVGVLLLLVLLGAGVALWWAARWAPPRDQYPWQGITIDASNGQVQWGSVKAAGADFAYIFATDGADRVDPAFTRNLRDAGRADVQAGAIHRYDLCRLATDQAANFIRNVPRRKDLFPAAIWLDFDDRCPDRPTRALLLSELTTFLAQIEAHTGKESLIAPSPAFEAEYHVTREVARTTWLRRDFFAPDYGAHPWAMWQANDSMRISGADGTVGWNVVRSSGDIK